MDPALGSRVFNRGYDVIVKLTGRCLRLSCVLVALIATFWARRAAADVSVTFKAVADTSIINTATGNSYGAGDYIVAGKGSDSTLRRALIRFDLTNKTSCTDNTSNGIDDCVLPSGLVVQSVQVDFQLQASPSSTSGNGQPPPATSNFGLYRLTQSWGEGTTTGAKTGALHAATGGDATWASRGAPASAWTSPGGTFAGTASKIQAFAPLQFNSAPLRRFTDGAGLRADVAAWVATPSSNSGWLMKNETEAAVKSLGWFSSKESTTPPLLHITYKVPQGRACSATADCASGLFCTDGVCCATATCPGATACRNAATCAPTTGVCTASNKPNGETAACNDSNPCTLDACSNGSCVYTADKAGVACGNPAAGECDLADVCVAGSTTCPDRKKAAGTGCTDDGLPCTTDRCNGSSNSCVHSPGNAGTVCRAGGVCDPAEVCTGTEANCPANVFSPASQECAPGSCQSSSTALLPSFCSGSSAGCPPQQTQSCGALVCTANACPGSCTQDSQCASGNYCAAPNCQPKKTNGSSCSLAKECTSGFCVDGVCCNTACGGGVADCQSCATGTCSLTTGVCRPASDACDVAESCSGSSTSCPADAVASASTTCRSASCTNGVETVAASCPGGSGKQCPAIVQHDCSPYVCGATACKTSCSSSSDCDSTHYCSGNQCVPRVVRGGTCSATGQCVSGLTCVDGVCCNSACSGQCQACDVNPGTCTTVPSGQPHGDRPACGSDGTLCAGSCNGTVTTSCFYPGASTECIAASCADGVETLRSVCNAAGRCNPKQTADCSPFSCGPTACFGNCSDNVQCEAGKYCLGGNCVPKLDNGDVCSNGSQCESDLCVDGVCCDKPCQGQCEACNLAGSEGTCSITTGAPVGGRPQCVTDDTLCGGVCDGKLRTSCTYLGAGTSCRAESCKNGVATLGAFCNGAGTCPSLVTQDCGAVGCNAKGTRCDGDCVVDTDCPLNQACSAGICRPKGGNGSACARDDECISGICTDGFCCNAGCQGQCEACDVPGSEGLCTPTVGPPHGTRAPCASDGSACAGTCDGVQRKSCSYPDTETSCGAAAACSGGIARLPSFCVGSGACPPNLSQICPGACSGTRCAGGCANDAGCGAGQYCSAGVCVPKRNKGQGCSLDSQCSSGFCVEGVCCETACTGQCFSCSVPGALGSCAPISGAPRGGREPCQGEGPCAAQCDGTISGTCAFPTEEVFCGVGSCSNGVASGLAVCSGAGSCLAPARVDCSPYQCDGAGCFVSCQVDDECQPGFHCEAPACVPDERPTGDGGAPNAGGSGGDAGEGNQTPSAAGDGSGGAPPDMPVGQAGTPPDEPTGAAGSPDGSPASGSKDSGGCGCSVPGGTSSRSTFALALVIGLALARRRAQRGQRGQRGQRDAA